MNERIFYSLCTLSPIHVGCGEEYEPTAFVIDEKSSRLISFDPLDFVDSLSPHEKTRFVEICRRGTIGSIIELYKFMRGRKMKGMEIDLSPGFLEHWQKTLRINPQDERKVRQELNRFGISRTAFSPADNRPYIPGSAIKGALRTAYLNILSESEKTQFQQKNIKSKDLERMLLGGTFETDPFRMLKISDFFPRGEVKTKIIYAVNKKKKPSKFEARGPSQILEAVEAGSQFVGTIAVAEPVNGSGIKKPLTFDALLDSAEKFFIAAFQRESQELRSIGVQPLKFEQKNGAALIRLGRHSGAESVTIEKHRQISIMQAKGKEAKFEKGATTLWIAANLANPQVLTSLHPFGWAILQEVSEAELKQKERDNAAALKSPFPEEGKKELLAPKRGPMDLKAPTRDIWKDAVLEWKAGSQTLIAVWQGKKAYGQGLGLASQNLKEKILGKSKKTIYSDIEVEPVGNSYRIVKIIE